MEQKANLKRRIEIILFVLTAVFTFLALAFKVYDVEMTFFGTSVQESGNGFQVISQYPEALKDIGGWLGLYNIIVIVAVIAEAIVYGVMFAKKSGKIALVEKILVIINVVLTFIYMINGFNAKGVIEEQSAMYVVKTSAFLPFIIVAILAVAYFIVVFAVKNIKLGEKETIKSNAVSAADELVKYKQLLDNGVITQEEYDAKKKELL